MSDIWYNNDIYVKGHNKTFYEIYPSNTDFVNQLLNPPYVDMINYYDSSMGSDYLNTVYLLLYSRYGNSSIASSDVNRFKANLVERLCAYGPSHKKRLDIQRKIRELSEEELQKGSIDITNTARNPNTTVEAGDLVQHINGQNQNYHKRSKIEALIYQYNFLDKDLNEDFLEAFKPLFSIYVTDPILYANYQEDEE